MNPTWRTDDKRFSLDLRNTPLRIFAILLVLILLPGCAGSESGGTADGDSARDSAAADKEDIPRGLRVKTAEVTPGYIYFSPLLSDTTYLIDSDGQVVHTSPLVVYRMSRNRLNQRARAMLLESR